MLNSLFISHFANSIRVVRRISRDTVERGRTLESIMTQYQTYVKPMHEQWVEPSKSRADVIINSETGHSVQLAVTILANHLKAVAGLLEENGDRAS